MTKSLTVSVIIPTLDESLLIEETLANLISHHPDEIIVADGGSQDDTVEKAARFARVVRSARGRASQMNAGAKIAEGDVLLFLHADTVLPPGGMDRIKMALANGKKAGRFRVSFDRPDWSLKLFAWYTRFQFFSYGDQGFFVSRDLFESMAGYSEEVAFEDIEFYRRLLKETRPVIFRDTVTTSARRFKGMGTMRQKWINLLLSGLYFCGFNVQPLKERLYPDIR